MIKNLGTVQVSGHILVYNSDEWQTSTQNSRLRRSFQKSVALSVETLAALLLRKLKTKKSYHSAFMIFFIALTGLYNSGRF